MGGIEINLDAMPKEDEQMVWTLLRLYADGVLRYDEVERGISLLEETIRCNEDD